MKKKNKINKKLQKIGDEIIELEQQLQLGKNCKTIEDKIEKLSSRLSFEEMVILDEYMSNKLTK